MTSRSRARQDAKSARRGGDGGDFCRDGVMRAGEDEAQLCEMEDGRGGDAGGKNLSVGERKWGGERVRESEEANEGKRGNNETVKCGGKKGR